MNNSDIIGLDLRIMGLQKNKLLIFAGLGGLIAFRFLLQFALYRAGFICLTADEFARTIMAAYWSQNPHLVWHGTWMPFHQYLLGGLLLCRWEFLLVPRAITIALGGLSIITMYFWATHLFESRPVGMLSAVLLAVNPLHLWLSSTPLAEMPHSVFLLAYLLSFTLYLKRGKTAWLAAGSFFLVAASGIRYEAWTFAAVFSLYTAGEGLLRFHRTGKRGRLLVSLTAAAAPWIFPALWLLGNWRQTGDPLYFYTFTRDFLALYGGERSYLPYLKAFFKMYPLATLLSLAGIIACLVWYHRDSACRWFLITAIIPFTIFACLQKGRATLPMNLARNLAPFLFLLYPAVACLIYRAVKFLARSRKMEFAILGLVMLPQIASQIREAFQFSTDPVAEGLEVGQRIRAMRRMNPASDPRPILIEASPWQYLAIHVGANELSTLIHDRKTDVLKRDPPASCLLSDPAVVKNYLARCRIKMVVVKSPDLREVMEKTFGLKATEEIKGFAFYPVEAEKTSVTNQTTPP